MVGKSSIASRQSAIHHGGFSLVEVLVIVSIIMLLVGIAVPSIGGIRTLARYKKSIFTIQMIDGACKMYANDFNGQFPPSNNTTIYPETTTTNAQLPSNWRGKELVVLLLTGYTNDTATPEGKPYDGTPNTMDVDDGKDSFGFRTIQRGKVYGPYNGAEKIATVTPSGRHPTFIDSFDNEIYYYRFNGTTYLSSDNDTPSGLNMPNYAQDSSSNFYRMDFVLMSAGADKQFEAFASDPESDDVTNFRE